MMMKKNPNRKKAGQSEAKIFVRDLIFSALVILIIGLCIYLLYYIKTESYQCISNPYSYSMNLLEKANGENIICTCNAQSGNFIWTKEGFRPMETFDYSNIKTK